MDSYCGATQSIGSKQQGEVLSIVETVANSYVGKHPALPFLFGCFSRDGFMQMEDSRYDLNVSEKLSSAKNGQFAYIFGMTYSHSQRYVEAGLSCYGPTKIYINGKLFCKSEVSEEVNVKTKRVFWIPLQKGWNSIVICVKKVTSGFGCIFGASRTQFAFDVMSPFSERDGWGGFIYSDAVDKEIFEEGNLPDLSDTEETSGLKWYPALSWNQEEVKKNPLERIYGKCDGEIFYVWTKLDCPYAKNEIHLSGNSFSPLTLWVDGNKVYSCDKAGEMDVSISLSYGAHHLIAECKTALGLNGFTLQSEGEAYQFKKPYPVKGIKDAWLYLGPFKTSVEDILSLNTVYHLFGETESEGIYWRVDRPSAWVRPYVNNPLFGVWNYPLGVTLYGLLGAGKMLSRPDIIQYVVKHMEQCTKIYKYAVWDAKQYGFSSVDQKLVELNTLDDCGSMGSAMLETYFTVQEPTSLAVADVIAQHITHLQERTEDGAFYRFGKGYFMEDTLWADDLYMSTPFLIRYYKLTKDEQYINDAARQFLLFEKYLWMEDEQIMSHVYDFKYHLPTNVPWGRGNGWVLFSLSEVLEVLPSNHQDREALLHLFERMCQGVLKVQGKNGLWHQVLNDSESYEEISCTAMFIYALARGIRMNFLHDKDFIQSARVAWNAICDRAIDTEGNLYGVCRGSQYSFDPDYYKSKLPWVMNDTHGIGIVLLAGIELSKLENYLGEQ